MKKYALMIVHTGMVKTRDGKSNYIIDVKLGDLMVFKRKKDAQKYIDDACAWALIPIAVYQQENHWKGRNTHYRFA